MAIGEAVLTILADVLITAVPAHSRRNSQESAMEILEILERQDPREDALSYTASLSEMGVSIAEAERCNQFLQAPEGKVFLALIATYAIGAPNSINSEQKRNPLTENGAALFGLFDRQTFAFHTKACQAITTTTYNLIEQRLQRLAKKDRELWSLVTRHYKRQAQLRPIATLGKNAQALRNLALDFPIDVREQITRLAVATELGLREIEVPGIGGSHRGPISEIRIDRTLISEEIHSDSLLRLMDGSCRLIIAGNPGEGKTTEIRYCAWTLSSAVITGATDSIPILLELRHLARDLETNPNLQLIEFIHETINAMDVEVGVNTIRYLLQTGRVTLFLDGLDEVIDVRLRKKISAKISSFCTIYAINNFVVSTRIQGYFEAPLGSAFELWRLQELNEQQIAQFTHQYFEFFADDPNHRRSSEFLRQSLPMSELRKNPLMLGLLCSMHLQGKRLPEGRLDLYSKCADLLYSDWDASRGIEVLVPDETRTREAIDEFALKVFREGEEEFTEKWLIDELEEFYLLEPGTKLADAMSFSRAALQIWSGRRWILTKVGTDHQDAYLRFTHRTFLEFFAAESIANNSGCGEDLWTQIEPLIINSTGSVVADLALEMYCRSSRPRSEDVMACALGRIEEHGEAEEYSISSRLAEYVASSLHILRKCSVDQRARLFLCILQQMAMRFKQGGAAHGTLIRSTNPPRKTLLECGELLRGFRRVKSDETAHYTHLLEDLLEKLSSSDPETTFSLVSNFQYIAAAVEFEEAERSRELSEDFSPWNGWDNLDNSFSQTRSNLIDCLPRESLRQSDILRSICLGDIHPEETIFALPGEIFTTGPFGESEIGSPSLCHYVVAAVFGIQLKTPPPTRSQLSPEILAPLSRYLASGNIDDLAGSLGRLGAEGCSGEISPASGLSSLGGAFALKLLCRKDQPFVESAIQLFRHNQPDRAETIEQIQYPVQDAVGEDKDRLSGLSLSRDERVALEEYLEIR
ncbi:MULTISPECIES: NACHT domain-containing protein [unclassified Luteococcus]|uniref:NACHT domain-containing protein n=1 Tax=unclassified Luteococcus TaxID=2639923 RepID=UPI00313C0E37